MNLKSDPVKFKMLEEHIFTNLENTKGGAYDNKAKMYEKLVSSDLYNKMMWGTLPSDYKDFSKMAISKAEGLIVDIGCGGLVQTAEIYSKARANCILVDNSIEMLKIAKQRIIELCGTVPDNINFLQANAFRLPFDDNSVDAVFSFGVVHVFENKKEFIDEAIRVLKPQRNFYLTSLTADRTISKFYMNVLRKQKEFGEPLTSTQTLSLFDPLKTDIKSYTKGSMVFIEGTKK